MATPRPRSSSGGDGTFLASVSAPRSRHGSVVSASRGASQDFYSPDPRDGSGPSFSFEPVDFRPVPHDPPSQRFRRPSERQLSGLRDEPCGNSWAKAVPPAAGEGEGLTASDYARELPDMPGVPPPLAHPSALHRASPPRLPRPGRESPQLDTHRLDAPIEAATTAGPQPSSRSQSQGPSAEVMEPVAVNVRSEVDGKKYRVALKDPTDASLSLAEVTCEVMLQRLAAQLRRSVETLALADPATSEQIPGDLPLVHAGLPVKPNGTITVALVFSNGVLPASPDAPAVRSASVRSERAAPAAASTPPLNEPAEWPSPDILSPPTPAPGAPTSRQAASVEHQRPLVHRARGSAHDVSGLTDISRVPSTAPSAGPSPARENHAALAGRFEELQREFGRLPAPSPASRRHSQLHTTGTPGPAPSHTGQVLATPTSAAPPVRGPSPPPRAVSECEASGSIVPGPGGRASSRSGSRSQSPHPAQPAPPSFPARSLSPDAAPPGGSPGAGDFEEEERRLASERSGSARPESARPMDVPPVPLQATDFVRPAVAGEKLPATLNDSSFAEADPGTANVSSASHRKVDADVWSVPPQPARAAPPLPPRYPVPPEPLDGALPASEAAPTAAFPDYDEVVALSPEPHTAPRPAKSVVTTSDDFPPIPRSLLTIDKPVPQLLKRRSKPRGSPSPQRTEPDLGTPKGREVTASPDRHPRPSLRGPPVPEQLEQHAPSPAAQLLESPERNERAASSDPAVAARVAELQYQVDIARQLLEEDRASWATEKAAATAARSHVEQDTAASLRAEIEAERRALTRLAAEHARSVAAAESAVQTAKKAEEATAKDRVRVDAATTLLGEKKRRVVSVITPAAAAPAQLRENEKLVEQLAQLTAQARLYDIKWRSANARNEQAVADFNGMHARRRQLHNQVEELKGNIRVVLRLRPVVPHDYAELRKPDGLSAPVTSTELLAASRRDQQLLEADQEQNVVYLTAPATGRRAHEFYRVYAPAFPSDVGGAGSTGTLGSENTRRSHEQQCQIFDEQVAPLLQSLYDGINVSVFAYGQTGSGKTHTIFGAPVRGSKGHAKSTMDGLLPQALAAIFERKQALDREVIEATAASSPARGVAVDPHAGMHLSMTLVELYLNDVYDLLAEVPDAEGSPTQRGSDAKRPSFSLSTNLSSLSARSKLPDGTTRVKCDLRQTPNGTAVVGARSLPLDTLDEAHTALEVGFAARRTHRTALNERSSRSHLLLTLSVEVVPPVGSPTFGSSLSRSSKLLFVDLAGSERVHKSLSQGDRLREAQHINLSLSALGDVMNALSSAQTPSTPPTPAPKKGERLCTVSLRSVPDKSRLGPAHVPYRNSKLTQLLQPCMGGAGKALMITCLCPHLPHRHNLSESAATLQFASRTRLVRNNLSPTSAQADTPQPQRSPGTSPSKDWGLYFSTPSPQPKR